MRRSTLGLGVGATLSLGVPMFLIDVAQRSFSTSEMAFVRVALAVLCLGSLTLFASGAAKHDLRRLARTRPASVVALGLVAASLPSLLVGVGVRHVPTGATAVLLALTPVWIAIGASLLDRHERVGLRRWIALAVAVAAVGVVCDASGTATKWGWYALPLVASVSYAAGALIVRGRLADFHPLAVTTLEMGCATMVLGVVALTSLDTGTRQPIGLPAVAAIVAAGVGCQGLGVLVNTALTQRVGAVRASTVSYTSVIVSVGLGVLVLHEPLTLHVVAGSIVLLIAVWAFLSARSPRRDSTTPLTAAAAPSSQSSTPTGEPGQEQHS